MSKNVSANFEKFEIEILTGKQFLDDLGKIISQV